MTVTILHPGVLTTIQDLGRYGAQKYGVIVSGAMDSYSLRLANLLVGNPENEGALEVILFGTTLQFEQDQLISITGGDLSPQIDGKPALTWRPILIKKGSILQFHSGTRGSHTYVAFAGGITVPEVMGSKSTYLRAGIGGFNGRSLQKGDKFTCGKMSSVGKAFFKQLQKQDKPFPWSINYQDLIAFQQTKVIRVLKGTEFERFDTNSQKSLFSTDYQFSNVADRMGYHMQGTALTLAKDFELLSEGVTYGTIQVPPNGQPIILMADRQTTGGYPKIGHVISADLAKLAQLQSGEVIRFQEVNLVDAEKALFLNEEIIQQVKIGIHLKYSVFI